MTLQFAVRAGGRGRLGEVPFSDILSFSPRRSSGTHRTPFPNTIVMLETKY